MYLWQRAETRSIRVFILAFKLHATPRTRSCPKQHGMPLLCPTVFRRSSPSTASTTRSYSHNQGGLCPNCGTVHEDTGEKSHDETHLETLFFSLGIEHHREDPVLYQPNLSMRPRVVTVLLANQRERAEEVFR